MCVKHIPTSVIKRSHGSLRWKDSGLTINSRRADLTEAYADLIVGAAGRVSSIHRALDSRPEAATYSRMAGLLLRDASLPREGFWPRVPGRAGVPSWRTA